MRWSRSANVNAALRFSEDAAEDAVVEAFVGNDAGRVVGYTFLERERAFDAVQDVEEIDAVGRMRKEKTTTGTAMRLDKTGFGQ